MSKIVKLDDVRDQRSSKKPPKKKTRLRDAFKYAAAMVAMPFVLAQGVTLTTALFPGTVSDPVNDYLAQNNMDAGFMEQVDGHNIRVYDTDALLMPFHYAGRMQRMNAGFIMNSEELSVGGKAKALFNLVASDYWGYLIEGAFDRLISQEYMSSASTLLTPNENADYYIVPPAVKSAERFVNEMTGIPMSHLRPFSPEDNKLFLEYIIRHEIGHTDVIPEDQADYFAIKTLEEDYPDADMAEKIRHLRAVSTFSRFLHIDYIHSTALELERFEKGEPVNAFVNLGAQRATLSLYSYLIRHADQVFDQNMNVKDYYISVYKALKDALDDDVFASDPYAEDLARLYMEGAEYYVPDIEQRVERQAQIQFIFPSLRP